MSEETITGELIGKCKFYGDDDKHDSLDLCLVINGRKVTANGISISRRGTYKLVKVDDGDADE